MIIRRLLLLAILTVSAAAALSSDIMYARYPALSPDGRTVAFTYMGDIWTVPVSGGAAHRLTVHEAEDIRPQFSPDGSMILFSSRRYDNYDVFVIPSGGGVPRRLTVHSSDDIGTGWFAGGDSVLFASARNGYGDTYKIAATGGTPVKLTGSPYSREYNARISSDGRYMIFNNGRASSAWWRRDLRAGRITDIFVQDRTQEPFTSRRLTDFSGHDIWPIYNEARGEVYFVSARGPWAQVWKVPFAGGEPTALTDFTGDGVQWLNANPQGTMLVFEQGFSLWILDPAGGTPKKIAIDISADEHGNMRQTKTFTDKVESYTLSPDEKKIAAVIHGEIYAIPADEPAEGMRITNTSARERQPVWGADSRTIYYSSDRTGNYDIYMADAVTGEETRLTDSPENEVKPAVSPDGKYLAFYRGLDKIIRIDLKSKKETVWVNGPFIDLSIEPTAEYAWSPDSKWLAFTMAGPTYECDIFVAPLDGEAHNISRFAGWNFRPRFSDDGKIVYFTSSFNDQYTTYKIDLMPRPAEFFEAAYDSLFMDDAEDEDKDAVGHDTVTVTIDFNRIDKRRVKAFNLSGSSTYPILAPEGDKYFFIASLMGKPEIWSINTEDDPDLTQLTHSGKGKEALTITRDGERLYYLDDGKINYIDLEKDKTKALSFTATMDIDLNDLNHQKFRESWQMLNSYFYDSTFHGADWAAVRDKYEAVIDNIRTEQEFDNLIMEMMGELRASHLYIYSREARADKNITTGYTGISFDQKLLDREGVFRIAEVLPKSPADLAGITAGKYVVAINGQPLAMENNYNSLLAGTIDHRLIVAVADRPGGTGDEYALKPISYSAARSLMYDDWVNTRRAMVDSLSGGRLAYIHIPAMNQPSLEKFKEELVSVAEKKDGLIIDVRNNGGGSIAVHLLGILVKTPYFLRNFRDFPVTSENKMRSKSLEKPMALLINGNSASNSEIFAEGFRRLKLGKIIGEPTAGAVIGTGSYTLIDGTRIRRPSWGAFTIDMKDTDLEPRRPDIKVENLPDDFINGRDPQLVRAVAEMLPELQ